MKIGIFKDTRELLGGAIYQRMLTETLRANDEVKIYDVLPRLIPRGVRPQQLAMIPMIEMFADVDVWVREVIAVAAMSGAARSRKNIALVHHIDENEGFHRAVHRMVLRRFYDRAPACDAVVVVAEYWREFLNARGLENIHVVHNGFDVERYRYTPEDVERFRREHGLTDRPTVYIGNPQARKGAALAFEQIKDCGYDIVTSGLSDIDLPIKQFRLPHSEYVLLLASCDVVLTMSTFLEGWNRVAHEAMLCRRPVVGSGTGGMGELLRGGGQMICSDFGRLREHVALALENADALGTRGYEYASMFTTRRFADRWARVLQSLR